MSAPEWIAVALGLANLVLLVRRSIWNYPAGIAMVTIYGFIFFEARLYSDALLQLFFLALNVYGWSAWRRARTDDGIAVRWLAPGAALLWVLGVLAAAALWGTAMQRWTNADFPHWDAAVAMASIAAQALLARRYVDNWIGWIIVDLMAIPLYWTKGLHLTAGLYGVFLVLSVSGLVRWRVAARHGVVPA